VNDGGPQPWDNFKKCQEIHTAPSIRFISLCIISMRVGDLPMLSHGLHFRRLPTTPPFRPTASHVSRCQKQRFYKAMLQAAWSMEPREIDERGNCAIQVDGGVTLTAHPRPGSLDRRSSSASGARSCTRRIKRDFHAPPHGVSPIGSVCRRCASLDYGLLTRTGQSRAFWVIWYRGCLIYYYY